MSIHHDNDKDRCALTFTVNNKNRIMQLYHHGYYNHLMSYEYLRKSTDYYESEYFPEIKSKNGIFITDSGAFSFFAKTPLKDLTNPSYWEPYLEEYCEFLDRNSHNIFAAANLDLDRYLGIDLIDEWNDKYFRPLESKLQIIYIAHRNVIRNDTYGLKRLEDYLKQGHQYVGVSSNMSLKNFYHKYYQLAKLYGAKLHGMGFTVFDKLMDKPYFTVDSSTWTMGSRFSETHVVLGNSFKALPRQYKPIKRYQKMRVEKAGLDVKEYMKDRPNDFTINAANLIAWMKFVERFRKAGNLKLWNKPLNHYYIGK